MNFFLITLFLISMTVSMSMVTGIKTEIETAPDSDSGPENEGRIVGGSPSEPHAHPYLVSIQEQSSDGSWGHFCGGVIVSSEKIVTAAHCLLDEDISKLRVVAGEHDLSVEEGTEQIASIKSAAIHPRFNPETYHSDFAYLYLSTNLKLNKNVAAIQLASFDPASLPGDCVSTGWGNTKSDGGVEFPNVLQQVSLAIVPKSECNVTWAGEMTWTMLCAGGVEGQGSCSADSGGPLVCVDELGQKYLGGIVSFGKIPCGQKGIPTIYSNVFVEKRWLEERAICPPNDLTRPCVCYENWKGQLDPSVLCQGSEVTQETLNRFFSTIRSYNGLTSDDLLSFYEFEIGTPGWDTSITTLDLTPFLRANISSLSMNYNKQMTSITGPVGDRYKDAIKAKSLSVHSKPMTDEGLGDALRYFDPQYLESLEIIGTKIHGGHHLVQNGDGSTHVEFLPGLSRFKKLSSLSLMGNPISDISGGQFKMNPNLRVLNLENCQSVDVDFGPSAFLFGEPDPSVLDQKLTIYLRSCQLREENFKGMANLGLLSSKRPIALNLFNNYVYSLPEEYFRPFLDAHPGNRLEGRLYLDCDQRMRWLKYNADIYRSKVEEAGCRGDPEGDDVFNTDLISLDP